MDTKVFESKMKLHGDTLNSLSKKMGINESTLCAKKNGKAVFNAEEIRFLKVEYDLSAEEVDAIFFG